MKQILCHTKKLAILVHRKFYYRRKQNAFQILKLFVSLDCCLKNHKAVRCMIMHSSPIFVKESMILMYK